jgi:hypothetical protein
MKSTYEVFIDVRSPPRHLDNIPRTFSKAYKLVDTGNEEQMVADAMREFAGKIAISRNKLKTETDIFSVLNKIREDNMSNKLMYTNTILNEVAKMLDMQWWGVGAD